MTADERQEAILTEVAQAERLRCAAVCTLCCIAGCPEQMAARIRDGIDPDDLRSRFLSLAAVSPQRREALLHLTSGVAN